MTSQTNDMAALASWLEEKSGTNQAEHILNHITKMQVEEAPLECMEIMLLADIIHGYRKEMLRQIKEYKALRDQEYAQDVATFAVRKELKNMKEMLVNSILCWMGLRSMYFHERALYLERCKWPNSAIACVSNALYKKSPPQSA